MTETNPHQGNIILHGGPANGERVQIADAVVRRGVLYVPLHGTYAASVPPPGRVATYVRRTRAEGEAGTCEARIWHEWHHTRIE